MQNTWENYVASLQKKTVAVLGVGISNTPLIRKLAQAGVSVTACDKKTDLGTVGEELSALGVHLQLGEGYMDNLTQDVIFRSPGIRPDVPALVDALARGSCLTSEMEVFFTLCPCRILAVTGSDGKTTTTTLISELLKAAGHTVHVGGNIGNPLLPIVETIQETDFVVLELSSFQLMTMHQSPQIAVMTNLSPNHLDIHKGMDEYREAKKAIFQYQNARDTAIFNADNAETLAISKEAKSRVLYFSRHKPLDHGVYLQGDMICLADERGTQELFDKHKILIPGEHNVENYLAAIAAAAPFVPVEVMQNTAETFGGVAHRIELVRRRRGVCYYNDSIASSPSRTLAGLLSFPEQVILIAGGYDKKIPFDALGEDICQHVKTVILNGLTAEKMETAIRQAPSYTEGKPTIIQAGDFAKATAEAVRIAEAGDVVLMSPACASFDQFPNFAARGNAFKEAILALDD